MRWETEARVLRRLGLRRGACGRRHRLFIGASEPRFACGSEAGVAARPFLKRPELGDDRWVPPVGPTDQRAGAGARSALRLLGCALLLGWGRGWAARAAAGPRGRAGGREAGPWHLPFSFLFFFLFIQKGLNQIFNTFIN